MTNEFSLNSEIKGNALLIKTNGYINNVGGQKILEEFNTHFNGQITSVLLNLENSKVVNSIGISYLIEVIEKLNNSNSKMVFTNLDSSVEKTFTIMGLFQFAEKAVNTEEALNKFNLG